MLVKLDRPADNTHGKTRVSQMIKKGQANREYTWQTWGGRMVRKCIDGCEAGTGRQSTYIEKLGSAG